MERLPYSSSAITSTMSRKPEGSRPDLFDPPPKADAGQAPVRTARPATARLLLPSNLESSLGVLSKEDFALLLAGVAAEAARREVTLSTPSKPTSAARAKAGQSSGRERAPEGVSAAKASLVRAAIKAGVKPSAIARQFGLSNAAITDVLRSNEK